MVEADLGLTGREFDGAENQAIGLRPEVSLERLLAFPTLDQHDRLLWALLIVDVAGGTTRLGQKRPLNGLKDLQHIGTSFRRRQNPERPDDHVHRRLPDSCRDESRAG